MKQDRDLGRTDTGRSGSAGFDFLHGRWKVRHRKRRDRLAGCEEWQEFPGSLEVTPILGGSGNFDFNALEDPAGPYEAHCLRLFRPSTGKWSIWWLDSRRPAEGLGASVCGGFSGTQGEFYGDDTLGGAIIQVRTTYQHSDDSRAQWDPGLQAPRGQRVGGELDHGFHARMKGAAIDRTGRPLSSGASVALRQHKIVDDPFRRP